MLQEVIESIAGRKRWVAKRRQSYLVKDKDFTVFPNDCWGAELYRHLDRPYNTPFVGLFVMAPCYIELLSNPRHYLEQELVFHENSRYPEIDQLRQAQPYPLATLRDKVEISFLHYHSPEEARAKWQRRVARINWNNLLVKFDGSKDGATPELVREFEQMPYKRLLLLKESLPDTEQSVVVRH